MPEARSASLHPGAELKSVHLQDAHLRRLGSWPKSGKKAPQFDTEFGLTAKRLTDSLLGVEFGVTVKRERVVDAHVKYRMTFEVQGEPGEERDSMLRGVAARLAPIVAYPYVRETITSLFLKAGGPHLILPVLNVGALFSPDEIKITELEDNEDADGPAAQPPDRKRVRSRK